MVKCEGHKCYKQATEFYKFEQWFLQALCSKCRRWHPMPKGSEKITEKQYSVLLKIKILK